MGMDSAAHREGRLFDGILLLSDLDGTLLDSRKNIPARSREAIRRFKEQGGLFSIATGRCPCSAEIVARQAEVNCPGVTLNGAVVYDFRAGRPAGQTCLPEWYQAVLRDVHAAFPAVGLQVYVGSDIYIVHSNDVVERLFHIEHTEKCRKEASFGGLPPRVNKALIGGRHEELQRVRRFLEGRLEGMYGMFTEEQYYELLPAHTNKGTGVRQVAEVCGVSPSCIAVVGDYYNDVEMLKSAAYPMVAGNAPDDVKIFARFIAGDCDGGVVADVIEHMERRLRERGRL